MTVLMFNIQLSIFNAQSKDQNSKTTLNIDS